MKDAQKLLHKHLKMQKEARIAAESERERLREAADLFRNSIGQVTPLRKQATDVAAPLVLPIILPITARPTATLTTRQHSTSGQATLAEQLSDEFSCGSLLDLDENSGFVRPGMGHDVLKKLRRGHWKIQDQLDLHGLHRDQARTALIAFLHHTRGRCVCIIHGKGLSSPNQEPVLKQKVRNWLAQKEEVLAFCQAAPANGGSGALLVLLRSAH